MKTIDPSIFLQTKFDSGALGPLASIVHQFPEAGRYRGVAIQGQNSATFYLTVEAGHPASQVDIDLASLMPSMPSQGQEQQKSCDCCGQTSANSSPGEFSIGPKGYVVFYVSAGPSGFAVHLSKSDQGPQAKAFDSRQLQSGDLFALALFRPGHYSIENALAATGKGGRIELTAPPKSGPALQPSPALRIKCGNTIDPPNAKLQPAQGLVVEITSASRVIVNVG